MSATLTPYLERLAVPPGQAKDDTPSIVEASTGGFLSELRRAGLFWCLAGLIGAHLFETVILLASWACIGAGALSGRFDAGWLAAWALALCSTIPLKAATTWLQGVLSIGFGGLLKQRLLSGAMAIDNDLVRTKGAGGLMSEVLESDEIDQLGASGGVEIVLASIELLVAPALFLWGAQSVPEIIVIAGWGVLSAALFAHNLRLRADWTRKRVGLTNRLIENMTAHRTRAAQQSPARWHLADDAALDQYLMVSRRLDNGVARIEAALPRGYVIAGFAALTPAFLSGTASLADLAISLGTILFAAESFERLCFGFSQSGGAWIAWKIIRPIFDAAGHAPPMAAVAENAEFNEHSTSVLQARGVGFTHANRHEPILGGCSFSVERGDQILLEGPSGSGKSTFAAILAGSRAPSDGFVLAGGLDRQTLGDEAWRRRVALAPQYHDNHIVSGPLIFNLLMSREYPHTAGDTEEALAVCRELGLGNLLERMPAGLNQIVGDTGWRLSQGERGRIFLARALLQKADVVVLDECLAALDPENLRQCLECVMRRSPTLIVIAHP
jgi:ATP-binding cassette subfamily B protein